MRQKIVLACGLVAALSACSDETQSPIEPEEPVATTVAEGHYQVEPRYSVTVINLTTGQPFTPPILATHSSRLRLWRYGRRASTEVQEIAENGNLAPMLDRLGESRSVTHVVVSEGPTIPPVLPGESTTTFIEGSRAGRFLSVISMLVCTNDGFTGMTRQRLPVRVGDERSWTVRAYDAGTEVNTEDFQDLVPPCAPLTGVDTDKMGTGMSNPALAENGRVRRHRGVRGAEDLIPALHGWYGPVARIEVTRVR